MSSTHLVQYKPLLEVVDSNKNVYYTEATVAEFEAILSSGKDHIYFSMSKKGVRKPYIVSYGEADPEDVMIEWQNMQLTRSQRACIESSKKIFLDFYRGTKPITKTETDYWLKLAKENKVAHLGR